MSINTLGNLKHRIKSRGLEAPEIAENHSVFLGLRGGGGLPFAPDLQVRS